MLWIPLPAMQSAGGWESDMITIRIPRRQWATAWRAMIELAPVRLVAADPIYEVLPAHLELLEQRGFSYEVVRPVPTQKEQRPLRPGSGQASKHRKAAAQGRRHAATG